MSRQQDMEAGLLSAIDSALKDLFERKHLYQSTSVRKAELLSAFTQGIDPREAALLAHRLDQLSRQPWVVRRPRGLGLATDSIQVKPPDVKLFCAGCDRLEAFNYLDGDDVLSGEAAPLQVFALTYHCQSCKGPPEVFLVRREGEKLTLCGRAPIEHVDVPKEIPRSVSRFYSGAVVAHQSGQTLAGNFLLRVLIEQWAIAYFQGRASGKADEIIDHYMDALPKDFKAHFPSLRKIYEVLSDDIHSAAGSSEVFEKACADLVWHFEARSVRRLPDGAPPPVTTS